MVPITLKQYKLEGLFESLRARMMGTVIGLQKLKALRFDLMCS
jgi:hypothetical protein